MDIVDDMVLSEIDRFFLSHGFNKIIVKSKVNYEKNSGYYMLSKGITAGYYLEYAPTLEEAENNCYEDIGAYSVEFNSLNIADDIKNDIVKYIL